jgi:hypothetical protein
MAARATASAAGLLCLQGGSCFVTQQPSLRAEASVSHVSEHVDMRGNNLGHSRETQSSFAQAAIVGGLGCAVVAVAVHRKRPFNARSAAVVLNAFDASKEIGACDPLLFWDPIGFCEGGTKEDFDRRQAS